MKKTKVGAAVKILPKSIRNRIVGNGLESPAKLAANPMNWRKHPDGQREALEGLVEEVGWIQTVIKNKRTGNLIDGHLRVELAKKRGEAKVPVVYVDLSPAEEKLALAMLDPIGAMAITDKKALEKLLVGLDPGNLKAKAMLSKMEEELGLDIAEPTAEEVLLDQAVQLEPGKEYALIMCDDEDEWTRLKIALDLKAVRRGGYKTGSEFDDVGTQRVVKAARLLARLERSAKKRPRAVA